MNDLQRDLLGAVWRKSSHSGSGDQCVEVAPLTTGTRAVRDSKDAGGTVLLFTADEWRHFVETVKARPPLRH
ncbi:DUF397 domain-containing protein [Actinomadura sp. HBU206391]|uniref:DUF397 domain-containing protein n=1 Tax=Actinomadura sp. HBU206391 TaxID=2731692 RepID=UPI00164F0E8F|nr:DUF397 domain-containing protein [Actinomadura sp. HBU206391]MBC6462250.1 DUF397 domain-containing protein [Actinomadura sp. HBU206391]